MASISGSAPAHAASFVCVDPPRTRSGTRREHGHPLGLALAALLAVAACIAGHPAAAEETLSGPVAILDGSTIAVGDFKMTLAGIAAPAADATCWDAHEVAYTCGLRSRAALTALIGDDMPSCDVLERPTSGLPTARCRVRGEDLGAWMLANGYAMPKGDAPAGYRQIADRAWGRRARLWSGVFPDPAGWNQAARRRAQYPP